MAVVLAENFAESIPGSSDPKPDKQRHNLDTQFGLGVDSASIAMASEGGFVPPAASATVTVVDSSNTGESSSNRKNKCSFRSCKVNASEKVKCAASNCTKQVHVMCSQGLVMDKYKLNPLPNGGGVCTKKCYEKALNDLVSNADEQEDGARTGKWDSDGLDGPDDPHTSVKILIDWWMEEGNYSKFCGKKNEGIKKKQFAAKLAEKMSQETCSRRDGKSVICKIQHIERTWKQAHNFATSETGAGIMESDGETQFKELVMKKCPYYYDIFDVMHDRASSEPKCTNYDVDKCSTLV
jgi:hypothetical protein